MLSPLFFSTHFYPWTSLCCCGAVFYGAGAFNGDLSTWQVGKVTHMNDSTYISPPLSKIGSFLGCFYMYFPSSFCGTNSIFVQWSLLFFFKLILSLDFFLLLLWCSVLQCRWLQWWSLQMAGRESDERAIKYVLSSPPSPRSGVFLAVSFFLLLCVSTNSIFEQCSPLFFFQPFLSLDFSLLLWCSVLQSWCLQW
jgi:surface protein